MRLRKGFLGAILLLAACLPLTASAEDAAFRPDVHLVFDRWLILGDGPYSLGSPALSHVDDFLFEPPAPPSAPAVRFRSSFTEKEPPALSAAPPGQRLLDLQARASSLLWGGRVQGEAALLGYGSDDPSGPTVPDSAPRLLRLSVTETWGWFESGVRFVSVSPGLENITGPAVKGDQEVGEAWIGVRAGDLRLEAMASELADNVPDDPRRARTTKSQARAAVELKLPFGSLVTLSESRGTMLWTPAARGPRAPLRTSEFESVGLTLYHYGGPTWDVSLSSTYTPSEERGREDGERRAFSHDVTASYRPAGALAITPGLSVSEEHARVGGGSRSLSASLSVVLAPLVGKLDLTLYGAYARSHTTDDLFDGRTIHALASLVWHLRRSPPTATLGFEAGYSRYVDTVSRVGGYEELRGLAILKIAAF